MFYVYKIEIKDTNEYYYGVRTYSGLDPKEDASYLGSGLLIKEKQKIYPKESFLKTVLCETKTKEEALRIERELVNEQVLNDPLNLNLTLGGQYQNCTALIGRNICKDSLFEKWREAQKLYNSRAHSNNQRTYIERMKKGAGTTVELDKFRKRINHIILQGKEANEKKKSQNLEKTKEWRSIILALTSSNLCDVEIFDILSYIDYKGLGRTKGKSGGYSLARVLEKLDIQSTTSFADIFSKKKPQPALKTVVNSSTTFSLNFLNFDRLEALNSRDLKVLASNAPDSITGSTSTQTNFKYLQHLGIVSSFNKIRVNIREFYPNSQRATGSKTIVSSYGPIYYNISESYFLGKEGENYYFYDVHLEKNDSGDIISILWNRLEKVTSEQLYRRILL